VTCPVSELSVPPESVVCNGALGAVLVAVAAGTVEVLL
jgi:hypothetical protein